MKINKPYVVTADIKSLLTEWGMPPLGKSSFGRPPLTEGWHYYIHDKMFWKLRNDFRQVMEMFPRFDFIPEEELKQGFDYLCFDSPSKVDKIISLDRAYNSYGDNGAVVCLQLNRVVDPDGKFKGYQSRSFTTDIPQQLGVLVEHYDDKSEYALLDDVIFSGSYMEYAAGIFKKSGIKLRKIFAGVGVTSGCNRLRALGYTVECVREYPNVIDVVCERDFYPGVPFSGRTLVGSDNVGIPYLLPFGRPGEWASIPQMYQRPFSRFCIGQTISLFEAIEKENKKKVACRDLPRKVIGLPADGTRFVDVLQSKLQKMIDEFDPFDQMDMHNV